MIIVSIPWGPVIAGVASSAVVSGVVSSMIAGRYDREKQLREKMIEAADDSAKALAQALEAVRKADPFYTEDANKIQAAEDAIAKGQAHLLDARGHLGRVIILHGPNSPPAHSAGAAVAKLAVALSMSEHYLKAPRGDKRTIAHGEKTNRQVWWEARESAEWCLEKFYGDAGSAQRRPLGPGVWGRVMRTTRWVRSRFASH